MYYNGFAWCASFGPNNLQSDEKVTKILYLCSNYGKSIIMGFFPIPGLYCEGKNQGQEKIFQILWAF